VWVDRDGQTEPLWTEPGIYGNPRLSPDGTRLSVSLLRDNNWDVWILDLERTVATRLTFGEGYDADQIWSPDGEWLAFASDHDNDVAIYKKRADGTGEAELVARRPGGGDWYPQAFAPDGSALLAQASSQRGDLWLVPLQPGGEPEVLLGTPFSEQGAVLSPDGRLMAYQSDESGRIEVYVRSFPRGGGKWQVSDGGGGEARFTADGRELIYRSAGGIAAVEVDTSGGFRVGRARTLFTGPFLGGPAGLVAAGFTFPDYEATADGRRFVLLADERGAEGGPAEHWVTLVTGWFEELERLAPAGGRPRN
jgi:serine/threonine-protein kinase